MNFGMIRLLSDLVGKTVDALVADGFVEPSDAKGLTPTARKPTQVDKTPLPDNVMNFFWGPEARRVRDRNAEKQIRKQTRKTVYLDACKVLEFKHKGGNHE